MSEGQTLCIVEAMKLMNEVKSSVSGRSSKDGEKRRNYQKRANARGY